MAAPRLQASSATKPSTVSRSTCQKRPSVVRGMRCAGAAGREVAPDMRTSGLRRPGAAGTGNLALTGAERGLPECVERTMGAINRVLARPRHAGNRAARLGGIHLFRPRLVIATTGRIGAYHEKIATGAQAPMAGARRQHHDVARPQRHRTAGGAAELDGHAAMGDPQHLMRCRVEVQEVVDAVAPGLAPAVAGEDLFKDGGAIAGFVEP